MPFASHACAASTRRGCPVYYQAYPPTENLLSERSELPYPVTSFVFFIKMRPKQNDLLRRPKGAAVSQSRFSVLMNQATTLSLEGERTNIMRGSLRGSPQWQIKEVFKCVAELGTSKHEAKEAARAQNGPMNWHALGKQIGVYGGSTLDSYRNISTRALEYARTEYGIRDATRIESQHIQGFLKHCIENGGRGEQLARASYDKYASALEKFETALNRYSQVHGLNKTYNFEIREVSKLAAKELGARNDTSRAYADPDAVVKAIPDANNHQLFASALRESGARISELSYIKDGRIDGEKFLDIKSDRFTNIVPRAFVKDGAKLMGIRPDKHTGELKGWIATKVKGGKPHAAGVSVATYQKLERIINEHGNFKIDQNSFRGALKEASLKTGQTYTGAHALRWNFASDRHHELQFRCGISYSASLSIVSSEMSHIRSDITCRYLK